MIKCEGCLAIAPKGRRRTSSLVFSHARATARQPREGCLAEAAPRRRPAEACRFLNTRLPSRFCKQPHRRANHANPSDFTSRRLGIGFAVPMSVTKRFVDGLRSMPDQTRFYTGVTSDVSARIEWHNAGRCHHTAKHRPWELVVAVECPQNAHRTKARSWKSGCARCCGVVLGTRPDSTPCTR